jgi:hypothetical protein
MADLEPQAQVHYAEMKEMAKKSRKFIEKDINTPVYLIILPLLKSMATSGEDVRDFQKAAGKLAPFFHSEFLNSKEGEDYRKSLLFRQDERAKGIRNIRSSTGNAHRPKAFWREWDEININMKDLKDLKDLDNTPI